MATDLARSSSDLDPRLLAGREASGSDVQPHYDLQLSVLETLATARNYNEWVASLVLPHLGDDPIEIGSGLGDQASVWLENGVGRITLSDLERRSVEALAERFAGDDRVSIRNLDLADCETGAFSSAVAVNVLEHIEDDIGALRATRALVRVGGKVIVFVPAFPLAMSRFDREIGHHRRYTTRSLGERLGAAGLEPLVVRYLNAPGLIAWIVMMRLLRRRPSAGPVVRAWDRRVIPIARRLERRRAAPFGQSVLAVAVRPPDG